MSIELAFTELGGNKPERTILFLHGILGRGTNLKTLAQRFLEERPGWKAVLADLRGHGRSPRNSPEPTLKSAALDVVELVRRTTPPVAAIAGHSFGGKVALESARIGSLENLEHVAVIDSCPGARVPSRDKDTSVGVLDAVESLQGTFASRTEFIELLAGLGTPRTTAQWLAQSLERTGDGLRFGLDLDEVRALITDFFARDLWPVVENPPPGTWIHLIIASRSKTYDPADRERAVEIASKGSRVTVDILSSGHWVHVDDPEGLLSSLHRRIPARSS